MRASALMVAALALLLGACASAPPIFTRSIQAAPDLVYDAVYHSLEQDRFWVIAEPNIGKTLSRNAERWGEDYNRNNLDTIRSMVFCNPWYANQLGNQSPALLALCPFNVTLLSSGGDTTIAFERPTAVATSGPAAELIRELEADVIAALDRAFDELDRSRR